ncbi:MAG: hypothetical protein ACXVE7_16420 [Solirubrobacteraceae bacterium]
MDDTVGDEHRHEQHEEPADERRRERVLGPPSMHRAVEDVER